VGFESQQEKMKQSDLGWFDTSFFTLKCVSVTLVTATKGLGKMYHLASSLPSILFVFAKLGLTLLNKNGEVISCC